MPRASILPPPPPPKNAFQALARAFGVGGFGVLEALGFHTALACSSGLQDACFKLDLGLAV